MEQAYPLTELRERIDQAQKILIFLPGKPLFDQVAAALSLFLTLEESGKTVSVICPTPMTVEFNHLVGVNRISEKVQGTDLVISLNYPIDQIEKVSYNDDNQRPNIVIQPKAGAPPLRENQVLFSYAGAGADLVITVGVREIEQIQVKEVDFSGVFVVNLDINPQNQGFGHLNIIDSGATSLSEVVLRILVGLNYSLGVDVAQNLLSGIWRQTKALTIPEVGANTYEAVAIALRSGAQKPLEEFPFRREGFLGTREKPEIREEKRPTPVFTKGSEEKKPTEEKPQSSPTSKPPADWFEPKIFKGTNFNS